MEEKVNDITGLQKEPDIFQGGYKERMVAVQALLHLNENFDILHRQVIIGGRKASEREKGIEWREKGERAGEMRGKSVKKRREKALGSPPGRAHAPFSLVPAPQAPPRTPGSAWVRRHQFLSEPAKNGLLIVLLRLFLAPAQQNRLERAYWGRGWRCP